MLAIRLVLTGALVATCLNGLAQEEHARWPVKTSVVLPMKAPRPIAFDDLAALQLPPNPHRSSASGDSTYQRVRYPAFRNSLSLKEGDMISVKGYLHLVAGESDGDFHIQISNSPTDGNHCIIVEIPSPDDEADPALKAEFKAARDFISQRMLAGKMPSSTGNVMTHPPYVEVAGALFLDDWHLKGPPRGKKKMLAATLWEVHPVVGIRFVAP